MLQILQQKCNVCHSKTLQPLSNRFELKNTKLYINLSYFSSGNLVLLKDLIFWKLFWFFYVLNLFFKLSNVCSHLNAFGYTSFLDLRPIWNTSLEVFSEVFLHLTHWESSRRLLHLTHRESSRRLPENLLEDFWQSLLLFLLFHNRSECFDKFLCVIFFI